MYSFVRTIIDTLFPPSEELLVVRSLTRETVDGLFRPRLVESVHALTEFGDPHVRALIHEAKFRHNANAYAHLGRLVAAFLTRHPQHREALWMSVPLSPARLRARGYNQVEEVLIRVAPQEHIEVNSHILTRIRHTRPQTELTREERLNNMKDAFEVQRPELVCGRDTVILDDVTTTGATLKAAQAALLPHQPRSVTLVALAH